jgi:hypothetical protein
VTLTQHGHIGFRSRERLAGKIVNTAPAIITGPICVSKQTNGDDRADLKRTHAELFASLQRCRELLDNTRSKLVANGNERDIEEERTRTG